MHSLLAIAVALAAGAAALPTLDVPHVRHEKRDFAATSFFVKRSEVPAGTSFPVRIGLTQSNLERGHHLLMDVADPNSPRYGKHYTPDEIIELFAPQRHTVNAVEEWLRAAGVKDFSQSVNKQWMQIDMNVEDLESLLRTKYHEYEHVETGDVHIACEEYHLPQHLVDHIDYVTPGVKAMALGSPSRKSKRSATSTRPSGRLPPIEGPMPVDVDIAAKPGPSPTSVAQCDRIVEPQCVRALYNISLPSYTTGLPNNAIGIFETGDMFDQEDLNLFFETETNLHTGIRPVGKPVDGAPIGTTEANGGPESLLDMSLIFPLIYPQKVYLFQTDDAYYEEVYNPYAGFLNNFFDAIDGSYCKFTAYGITGNSPGIDPPYPDPNGYNHTLQCGKYKPTNVISISYGEQEVDLPLNYQRRQCAEIMKLGMQGVTVIVASGDSGVGVTRGANVATCLGPKGTVFTPDYPASCPYITSAGATYLPRGANVLIDQERAVDRFPSGGGFSNIYPTPDYQQTAVNKFLEFYNPYPTYSIANTTNPTAKQVGPGIFNRGGRGYPDIGALGDNVLIYVNGSPHVYGGTSASAPTFAGIINRINEERLLANKTAVGFINPVLYANPTAFHDITNGSNPNCASPGFNSVPGWDPVTGLGTPNYPALLKVFMALP